MNATTQQESTALTLPQRAAVALGAAEHEIKLRELVKSSVDIVAVIDPAGREQAHRIGMTLKNARVSIEKSSKTAREDAVAFGKAVIAEEKRLIEIVTGEETRVFGLRDGYDEKVEAERQAAIAAEMARTEAIGKLIDNLRMLPAYHAQSNAAALAEAITEYDGWAPNAEDYAEFVDKAAETIAVSLASLRDMLTARQQQEQAAADAEAARLAEIARLAAERAELEALRAAAAERDRVAKIESDRIAAEQAAEAKRLAELAAAQEAEARVKAETAAADLRALAAAQAERARLEQAERDRVAAESKAQLEQQAAALAAERAAFEAEQRAAQQAKEAAAKLEADHAEALIMHEKFYTDTLPGGQRYSGNTFKDNGEPILLTETGARSIFCDLCDDYEEPKTDAPIAPPTLRLGQISERLGFTITADFLRGLGFEHSATDKAAKLYHEHEFKSICAALCRHISAVSAQH